MLRRPGLSLQEYANAAHVDRSTISKWVNQDEGFKAALEEAKLSHPITTAQDVIDRLSKAELDKLRARLGGGSGEPIRARPSFPGEASIEHLAVIARRVKDKGHQNDLFDYTFALWRDMGTRWGMPGFKDDTIYPVEAILPMAHRARGTLQELISLGHQDVVGPDEEAEEDDAESKAYQMDLRRLEGEMRALNDPDLPRADDDSVSYQGEGDAGAEAEEDPGF